MIIWRDGRPLRQFRNVANPAARVRLLLWANSVCADARVTSPHPPGNSEVSGQVLARTRRQGQSGPEARGPQIASGETDAAGRGSRPVATPVTALLAARCMFVGVRGEKPVTTQERASGR
jgi:hypothetical protein